MTPDKLKEALKAYQLKSVHPAAAIFPMLSEDEYLALVEDIKAHGFATKATCDESGRLIDGRNRICASMDADLDLEITVEKFDSEKDVLDWIVSNNIRRRHLDRSQLSACGAELLPMYEADAKKRQLEALARGNATKHGSIVADLPQSNGHKSRDDAAAATGASPRGIQQAKRVKEASPELFEKVKAGEIALDAAEKQVKQKQAEQAKRDPQQPTKPDNLVTIITADGVSSEIAGPKTVRFNKTNDSVDWASWTWNPITGCNHGCSFCYAREIAHSERMAPYYPNKFEPTFHEYRLAAPKNTPVPDTIDPRDSRVFVCSMADLFGKWVPDKWIRSVFEACIESPDWEYLFLTKWPASYAKMPLLDDAWYGASIVTQSDVSRIEAAMQKFKGDMIKWVSMEPMLEPIKFNDLSWCDLVVIGAQTSTTQPDGFVPAFSPKFDWIVDVVNQCRKAGVPYYLKANLGLESPGMDLPKSTPRRR